MQAQSCWRNPFLEKHCTDVIFTRITVLTMTTELPPPPATAEHADHGHKDRSLHEVAAIVEVAHFQHRALQEDAAAQPSLHGREGDGFEQLLCGIQPRIAVDVRKVEGLRGEPRVQLTRVVHLLLFFSLDRIQSTFQIRRYLLDRIQGLQ